LSRYDRYGAKNGGFVGSHFGMLMKYQSDNDAYVM